MGLGALSLRQRINIVIESFENSRAPFFYFGFAFLTAVLTRLFLEFFTSPFPLQAISLWHFFIFYLVMALAITFCLTLATKQPAVKTLKIISAFFFFILLAPLIDLLISRGAGAQMTYLLPQAQPNLWQQFLTFGLQNNNLGLTWGIRLEVFLGLLGIFFFVYLKSRRLWRSLLTTLAVYGLIFFFAVTPFILQGLASLLGVAPLFSDYTAAGYFWTLFLVFAVALFIISKPQQALILIRSSRWLRVAAFLFLAGVGFWLGLSSHHFFWNLQTFFNLLLAGLGILAGLGYAYIVNDLQDTDSDRLSHSPNILVDKIPQRTCQVLAGSLLVAVIISAVQINVVAFFLMALMLATASVYSLPPWRLKRVVILAKAVIGLEALLVVMLGFTMAGGSLADFPKSFIWFFLLVVSLAANFVDLKDYQADKQAGLRTLPVVLGFKSAKILIGFFLFLAYAGAYWLFQDFLRWPSALLWLGILVFLLFLKKYQERTVLIIFLLSLAFILVSWRY